MKIVSQHKGDAVVCHLTSHKELDRVQVKFGLYDTKGRTIGGRYSVRLGVYKPNERGYGLRLTPGDYFILGVHATRDGYDYGASNESICGVDRNELVKLGEAKIAAMKARYQKQFGAKK